ncbi:SDR family oxidoreductase [Cupriavidus metallidurans]|uniref:UDP-glucose 4-epimerase family protein n=1 Tax=Cupriavidus metallidurans TaxID=119219 RepID=UPI003D715240
MKVLVTGANGVVGRAVLRRLLDMRGMHAVGSLRRTGPDMSENAPFVVVGDLSAQTDWSHALDGVNTVVHAAARVHVMNDTTVDSLLEFRRVNVQGTLALARQASALGVKRFVFISSVKANGEETQPGQPFTTDDVLAPVDPYGISKMESEQGLSELAAQTGLEVVIIRPPLVYGPDVKANFLAMMRWLKRGVPLPLGAIHNLRSLVALDNLVDLIVTCVESPAAANQTFLVSDGDDLSTTELLRRMGSALGTPARLIPVPSELLRFGAALVGRPDIAQRLCGSLQVDITKTRQVLGWQPPVSVDEGLRKAAEGYLREAIV